MTFLFDLDDTIIDDSKTKEYYLPELFKDYKIFINRTFEEFSKNWTIGLQKYFDMYVNGQITFIEQRYERIRDSFGNYKLDEKNLSEINNSFDLYLEKSWILFEEWKDFFENSKTNRAIVTNGDEKLQSKKITKLGLDRYFDHVFISESIGFPKPDIRIFEHVCKKMNIDYKDCVFIGDNFEYDILGSKNAGMKPVWINHKNISKNTDGIETFTNIKSLIKRLKEIEKEGL